MTTHYLARMLLQAPDFPIYQVEGEYLHTPLPRLVKDTDGFFDVQLEPSSKASMPPESYLNDQFEFQT